MYTLVITDLTHLGGLVGTEYTTYTEQHYKTVKAAKEGAEKHYNGSRGPIRWSQFENKWWHSQDLGYVMYKIKPLKIEE